MNTNEQMKAWMAHFVSADPEHPEQGILPIWAPSFEEAVKQVHRFITYAPLPLLCDGLIEVTADELRKAALDLARQVAASLIAEEQPQPQEEHREHATAPAMALGGYL